MRPQDEGNLWIRGICGLLLLIFLISYLTRAFRRKSITVFSSYRSITCRRDLNPAAYWFWMLFFAAVTLLVLMAVVHTARGLIHKAA